MPIVFRSSTTLPHLEKPKKEVQSGGKNSTWTWALKLWKGMMPTACMNWLKWQRMSF